MAYDIAVDIDTSVEGVCRNVAFPPIDGVLAGYYNIARMRSGGQQLQAIGGELPGQRIELDVKRGKARVIDRLRLPENVELLSRIRAHMENSDIFGRASFGDNWVRKDMAPDREYDLGIEPESHPPNNRDTWLWHIARLVHHKDEKGKPSPKAVVVRGVVPTDEEVVKSATQVILKGDRQGIASVNENSDFNVIKPGQK